MKLAGSKAGGLFIRARIYLSSSSREPGFTCRALHASPDLLVGDEILQPENEFSGDAEDLLRVVLLGHLVEELDDVGEVHVAVEDDVSVVLDEGQGHEQEEVARDDEPGGPDGLPDQVDITIGKLSLEIQQEPPEKSSTFLKLPPSFLPLKEKVRGDLKYWLQ